jgi:hypothetical protein
MKARWVPRPGLLGILLGGVLPVISSILYVVEVSVRDILLFVILVSIPALVGSLVGLFQYREPLDRSMA